MHALLFSDWPCMRFVVFAFSDWSCMRFVVFVQLDWSCMRFCFLIGHACALSCLRFLIGHACALSFLSNWIGHACAFVFLLVACASDSVFIFEIDHLSIAILILFSFLRFLIGWFPFWSFFFNRDSDCVLWFHFYILILLFRLSSFVLLIFVSRFHVFGLFFLIFVLFLIFLFFKVHIMLWWQSNMATQGTVNAHHVAKRFKVSPFVVVCFLFLFFLKRILQTFLL
jgi:hypothetical protein